jgi:hypothetical protein
MRLRVRRSPSRAEPDFAFNTAPAVLPALVWPIVPLLFPF